MRLLSRAFLLGAISLKAQAFIVEISPQKARITPPPEISSSKMVPVVVKNHLLVNFVGEIRKEKLLTSVSVAPGKEKSYQVLYAEGLTLRPLSPPAQEIPLNLEGKPYEIPPLKRP